MTCMKIQTRGYLFTSIRLLVTDFKGQLECLRYAVVLCTSTVLMTL